jgi:hypothetical protein
MTYEEFQKELEALLLKFFGGTIQFTYKFPFRLQILLPNVVATDKIGLQVSIGRVQDLGDVANPDA